jgi:LCP family protein required for cell wall assembly
VLLGLTTAVLAAVAYTKYNGQIKRISVLQTNDPNIREATKQQNAVNFLIIGSDTRAGADAKYGNAEGARSDTNIIVHLSPDHQHVTVISIPRDSFVAIPACKKADGTTVPAHPELFNSAFSVGGPACTVATVQKLTGIEITHYLEVDFAGFANMVNAIGTVTICSPQVVNDPMSGLRLKKGNNALNGAEALQYVRARESLGNGSDLERIQRQQLFMGAVLRQAVSGRMLSNPVRLTQFLDAATKSITVDKGTSFADLRTLAESMQGLNPAHVVFYTAPIKSSDYHPRGFDYYGKVLLDPVAGRALYDSVINDDVPVLVTTENGTPTVPVSTATASSSPPATTPASPSAAPLPKPNGTAADVTCKI